MYLDQPWEEIDGRCITSLIGFLHEKGIPVGKDFLPAFTAARSAGWKVAEETEIEHTLEEAMSTALTQLGYASLNGLCPQAVEHLLSSGEVHWTSYPGALETLQALKDKGLLVGVISNADDDGLVQRTSLRLGYKRYASPVLSSAGMRWRKPNPRIFDCIAGQWGIPPEQIAMVGDAPRYDILGAHRAGMRGILIDRHENNSWQTIPPEMADNPALVADAVVGHLLEIPEVIERL